MLLEYSFSQYDTNDNFISHSILEQSYIDEEVFRFTHAEVEDSPAVEEGLTGRLAGDCTPEQAVM